MDLEPKHNSAVGAGQYLKQTLKYSIHSGLSVMFLFIMINQFLLIDAASSRTAMCPSNITLKCANLMPGNSHSLSFYFKTLQLGLFFSRDYLYSSYFCCGILGQYRCDDPEIDPDTQQARGCEKETLKVRFNRDQSIHIFSYGAINTGYFELIGFTKIKFTTVTCHHQKLKCNA